MPAPAVLLQPHQILPFVGGSHHSCYSADLESRQTHIPIPAAPWDRYPNLKTL